MDKNTWRPVNFHVRFVGSWCAIQLLSTCLIRFISAVKVVVRRAAGATVAAAVAAIVDGTAAVADETALPLLQRVGPTWLYYHHIIVMLIRFMSQ